MTDLDPELDAGAPLADPMLDSLYRRMRTMHSLYRNGQRHMGEIELACGPVGLGGMTS